MLLSVASHKSKFIITEKTLQLIEKELLISGLPQQSLLESNALYPIVEFAM
jgi:hypothetical protein